MKSAQSPSKRVLHALDRIGETDLQEIVDLVHLICGTEAAGISILESGDYHLLVTAGVPPMVCDGLDAPCAQTMSSHSTVVVEDARADARFRSSRYVDGTFLSVRFYASAPIYAPDGTMVGRLCVLDSAPRRLGPLQERTLTTLAGSITKVLELRMLEDARADGEPTPDDAVRVAAQISHDLRIPLTALTSSLAMLDDAATEDLVSVDGRLLGAARRSAERMTRMVDGLLRLNDAGRVLDLTDVDLAEVVEQVVADTGPLLEQGGAALAVGRLPVLRGDASQLYSVFLNLVSNALKFARPGTPPVIRIASRRVEQGWRISVTDNGRGIPETRRGEVFSMFARLDPSSAGSGIGLTTVRRAIEQHGGRVGVEDAPGHGVEVWFELPDQPPGG